MNPFSGAFVAALTAETGIQWWLATRQIAAARAHRDRVPAEFAGHVESADQRKAADYNAARLRVGRWATLTDAAVRFGFTVGGGLAVLDAAIRHLHWPDPWAGGMLIGAVLLLRWVLALPFSLWRTFRVESRFGFNRISPGLYAVDAAKQLLLAMVLGVPLTLATLVLMERAGRWWWVCAWLAWLGISLVLVWAAPRFIAPLFNRFTAIDDPVLEQRVAALLERCGFTAAGGVFVMDGSRRSAHGNAYFTGIGRNKRIVIFDTLLARIDLDEIEAVLAHELGHFRLRHVRQRLVTSMAAALVGFGLLGALAADPGFYRAFGVAASAATALLLFAFVVPPFTFFATPLASWWSRRQELAADDFAAAHASAAALASALVKLYRDNATTLTPDPVHSAFYDSHPTAIDRITRLRVSPAAPPGRAPGRPRSVPPTRTRAEPAHSRECPPDRGGCGPAG